jgi:hypothetical protein
MGFLDHSTNNIIIDAVLTDTGRAFLARNDGSFSIVKFALGDDEVDYTTIPRYGRTVGKERIEKNTPILEAETMGNFALKHRMISLSNPNLIRLPNLTLSVGSTTFNIKKKGSNSGESTVTQTVQQSVVGEVSIDNELKDSMFIVRMNNAFLQLASSAEGFDNVDSDNIATYTVQPTVSDNQLGSQVELAFQTRSITSAQWAIYGNVADKSTITTIVTVTGMQSGAMLTFNVNIQDS